MKQKRKWHSKFICTLLVINNLVSSTLSSMHVRAEEIIQEQTEIKIDSDFYKQNEVIVQYRQAPSQKVKSYAIKEKETKGYQETFLNDIYSVIETDNTSDFVQLIGELEQDNTIVSIQPNYIYYTMETTITVTAQNGITAKCIVRVKKK